MIMIKNDITAIATIIITTANATITANTSTVVFSISAQFCESSMQGT